MWSCGGGPHITVQRRARKVEGGRDERRAWSVEHRGALSTLDARRSSYAAFTAGVAGPLVGADLLHLRDLARTPVGIMSIGGAGTFDGIILSGVLAALLA